jgi:hypothetical protein
MAKLSLVKGTTSKMIDFFVQDSSSTTGAGLTGLTSGSSGLTAYYYREGANASVSISLTSATLGTFTSAGFIVVDGTNMPGVYQLGIPNAALAIGAASVVVMLKGATNMAPVLIEIELTASDNQDGVRFGLTALPNANASASGGLPTVGTGSGQITLSSGAVTAGTVSDKTGYSLTQSFPTNFASLAITGGGAVTAGTVSDKTGYSLTQSFPSNFASLAITVGGAVTAGTVSDKTGYSLTQTFPTHFSILAIDGSGAVTAGTLAGTPANFSSMAITPGGAVTAGTVTDKTGYSLTQAFPSNFASMAISGGGAVTAGTVSDKTGYSLTQSFPSNFATMSIDGSGRVTYAPGEMQIKRNVGFNHFQFVLFNSVDHVTPISGLTVTSRVSVDGASPVATVNTASSLANGIYNINLAAADTNGTTLMFEFTATGADPTFVRVITQA